MSLWGFTFGQVGAILKKLEMAGLKKQVMAPLLNPDNHYPLTASGTRFAHAYARAINMVYLERTLEFHISGFLGHYFMWLHTHGGAPEIREKAPSGPDMDELSVWVRSRIEWVAENSPQEFLDFVKRHEMYCYFMDDCARYSQLQCSS